MAYSSTLISSLEQQVQASISSLLVAPSRGHDLYELYIFSLIVEAARHEGAAVEFFDVHDNPVTQNFIFRTSPSRMFATAKDYTHGLIRFNACPELEIHLGIYVAGKSGVTHECDVAVIFASAANTCRSELVHPKSSQLILAVECKFYVAAYMGIGLARSYLGLASELQHTNRDCFFVGVSESVNVQKMLLRHQKDWETGVFPADVHHRAERLGKLFEKTFRDYKLRYT